MRNERLSSLLSVVEESFAYSQYKIESLSEELARVNEEKQQIQAMLQTLLAEGEDTGARGIGAAMRDLEDRINRLVETASSISGAASSDAPEMTTDSPATVDTDEDDRTAAGPETDTELASMPSAKILKKLLAAAEKATRTLHEEREQASTSFDTETAPEEGKKVEHQSLLDIPDFLDRRDEVNFTSGSRRAGVRRRS
jgi:uncharacterized phage infection (PIP) family protein YhgE